MKTVLLEELDPRMSEWLLETSRHEQVVVTDRGRPIVTITPMTPVAPRTGGSLAHRVLLPEFAAVMKGLGSGGTDSTEMISQDREDRL